MPSNRIAERILQFIDREGYEPSQVEQLARAMGIGEEEQGDFRAACKALMKTGRVILGSGDVLRLPPLPGRLIGTFRKNPRGFGFVIPETPNAHGDLYVPAEGTGDAITGDTVVAIAKKKGKRSGKMIHEGKIIEILKRGNSRFVGELKCRMRRWFVIPDGHTLHSPIMIADVTAKGGKDGDQVVVEIIEYPTQHTEATGVIVKVLGERGRPDVAVQSIIEQYQLPNEFPEEVLDQASKVVRQFDPESEIENREDFTGLQIITIDPKDAKDFDDAISVEKLADGTFELGVHIADVAHFVKPGSALDKEAQERGNSVYLARTVLPMLPEVLSNGVCSLQERELRLTKSAIITYDENGMVQGARFANGVIKSMKRLTYEQATTIIEGKKGRMSAKVVALVQRMENLAQIIQARRKREGMLTLSLPSVKPVFDENDTLIDVMPEDTSYSHTVIEMFMVEANEAVARLFSSRGVPAIRRIHENPDPIALTSLRKFLGSLGFKVSRSPTRTELQKIINQTAGEDTSFAVNFAILRSMQQAIYSPQEVGHYALASEDYTHFTSPIRRYPDLVIHRMLSQYLETGLKTKKYHKELPPEAKLSELGNHCSATERHAEGAERELMQVLTLRLLEDQVGEEFEGIVTGVTNVGVFVQLDHYLVEGLLRFDHLEDDWWEVNSEYGAVVGERSGKQIRIGDRLLVSLSRIDIPQRQLDLVLVKTLKTTSDAPEAGARRKPARGRKPSKRKRISTRKSRKKR